MTPAVPGFLNGGGEMGQRMRAFDWRSTPLGEPEGWPQSLKTIVRVMLDSRFAMWMAWGPQGTFFCNDAYLPTVGFKRDWVLGARADRVWQEIWLDIGPRIEHVLNTGQATWDEGLQLFLRRSGFDEETFHTFSYSPVYDDASQVAGMLCVVVEDTDRVLGRRRLALLRDLSARSSAELPSLDAAGTEMLGVLARGRFDVPFAALYLRAPQGLRLVGATAQPRRGQLPAVALPESHDALQVALLAAAAHGAPRSVLRLADSVDLAGPWQEPLQQALAVPLGAGSQAAAGCLLLGVSTRRPLDQAYRGFLGLVADQFASQLADVDSRLQAERRAAALAELDRAKNVFFSNVSHEFRTPLTLMLGPLDNVLDRAGLPQAVRDDLELVRQNGARLRRLVNSLLDFSRIEAGRVQTHFQRTDLAALTTDLAAVFRAAVESAGLRLLVRCEPQPEAAYVDRDMWEKVVLNLLSNALKFTFEGEIEVALEHVAGHAQLVVRDTGIGIAAEALAKVFDRFHRIEGVRSRSQEGSGIGLALVKELVRLHGGSVDVASEVGRGTRFTVRVPLGSAHLSPEQVHDAPAPAAAVPDRAAYVDDALRGERSSYDTPRPAALGSAPPAAPGARRILVVDDNADMRAYIARLLEPVGTVLTAADGEAAWDSIVEHRPDLVVSDMMMPRLDGRGLIERIRGNALTQTLPVIVLSAQAGEEARVAGLNQGADDYLVKPFSAPELVARAEVQLLRASLRQAEDLRNKRLADIFRNAPVAVAVLRGPQHVFEFTNAVYQRVISDRAVLGLPLLEALPEIGSQGWAEVLDRVLASGEVYRGHAVPVRLLDPASGQLQQRHFEFVFQPLPAEDGHVAGIAVIAVDVDEVVRARTTAEAANRAKDEFIAMLGHELRNPLAPIFTALQVMAMRQPGAMAAERELITRQVQHMARLVDDLLDVSRVTRGELELKRSVTELAVVVHKAVEMSQPLMESKRQVLTVQVPDSGLLVLADPVRLGQVMSNVLTNAAKFTGVGGRIDVQARADGAEAVFTVRDSGIGMSAAELESVFELFVQGRQGINRAEGGLGLGLTIARNLARLHGGSLQAASAGPGQGSSFTLRLPLHQPQRSAAPDGAAAAPAAAQPALAAPGQAARRVLVVDDNLDAARSLADLLGLYGHEVELAEDGPGALAKVQAGPAFDVALVDIGLPVMSGYELAPLLRQHTAPAVPRLVALTGYGMASDRERARDSGFDEHFTKPVDIDALLASIDKAGRAGA